MDDVPVQSTQEKKFGLAVWSFILAISAWTLWFAFEWLFIAFFLFIVAVFMGHLARVPASTCQKGGPKSPGEEPDGAGLALLGLIIGYTGLVLFSVAFVMAVVIFIGFMVLVFLFFFIVS